MSPSYMVATMTVDSGTDANAQPSAANFNSVGLRCHVIGAADAAMVLWWASSSAFSSSGSAKDPMTIILFMVIRAPRLRVPDA